MLHQFARFGSLLFTLVFLCPLSFAQDEKEVEPESGDGTTAADQPLAASDEAVQAMGGFKKPEGWSVSLFAAEPEFANPVCLFVDNQSRLFVCESFRQNRGVTDNRGHDKDWLMADLAANSVQDRIDYHKRLLGDKVKEYTAHDDRIRLVIDSDGDGKADKSTIFAEHFNKIEDGSAAGILVRGNQAYFTCIPKLWKLTDSDNDGVAESRTAMHDGFGVRVAFRGHDMHGLIIGHDGRLYFSIGDRGYNVAASEKKLFDPESGAVFRCELDGSKLEVFATGLRNPQELAFDDFGYLFTGDNNSDSGDKARWVNVMEGGDTGWRMMYQYISDRGPFNREKIWHPFSKETPAYIVPPIENISDGPSGLACYPGTGLTGDYKNCFFLVDFRGGASNSGIRLIRAQPHGAFWKIERSEQTIWNILATDAQFGPDGALWVCDWVNGWIGEGKGRVYRFTDDKAIRSKEVQEVQQLLKAGMDQLPADRLAQLLSHVDRRIRLEAQWELAIRGELERLNDVAQGQINSTFARLHATWGLGHIARVNSDKQKRAGEMLSQRLNDSDSHVRAAAILGLADAGIHRWGNEIVALIADPEPQVQYAAAIAAGKLKLVASLPSIVKLLETNADQDPGLRHGGIMALAGLPDVTQVVALSKHASRSVRIAAVVALRKRTADGISQFLNDGDLGVQTEAARAINDVVALHSQLPKLAGLIGSPLKDDGLAHRVLNANFRLGTAEGAAAIAAFAADDSNSDTMRLEAVEMLGAWSRPGKLDRVMNRYLPLDDRSPAPAKAALQSHFAKILSGSKELQTKGLEVATELKIDGLTDVLRKYAFDVESGVELRSQAIEGIVTLEKSQATNDVKKLLNDKDANLRAKVLGLYSQIDPVGSLAAIEKATRSDYRIERQAAWDALATNSADGAKSMVSQGLRAYIEGKLSPDVWMNVIEAAEGKVDKTDIEKLNDFEKKLAESDPLASYRDCTMGGDVAAGKKIFFTKSELSCVRCHKVGDRGGDVGPVLTEIAKTKDNRYLLESIVNPDAKIAEKFETIVLLTDDGQVFTGILRKDTDETIELMDAEGKVITVETASVEQRKKGKSSMPPDLIKHMTRRELRDLIAYLASLK
jgi:quinoprotein glucose dehydrogenase